MADHPPDPVAASGPAAFVAALRELRKRSGLSYRAIEGRAYRLGYVLPRSTLVAALSRDTLPREGLVTALVAACGCASGTAAQWLQAHRDAALASLTAPVQSAGSGPRQALIQQLPADVAGLAGRAGELNTLDGLLPKLWAGSVAPVVISGPAGIGKTAVAVHWSHRVTEHFPDGQLYVNLHGFDQRRHPIEPSEALAGFLSALEPSPRPLPVGVDALAGRYRSLLAGRRMLVVLDNARDAEQVQPLLPGAAGCLVLVTSRHQLTTLVVGEGSHPIRLEMLTRPESFELLALRLSAARLAAHPEAVEELITRCAGLPLALAIAAARAAIQPELSLQDLVQELGAARQSLDGWSSPEAGADLRAAFDVSYRTLSVAGARLFRLLALHPGPEISLPAVAALLGVPVARARPLLAELTNAHLITTHAAGRYRVHDLLRTYASELAGRHDPGADRQAATRRMLDFYLHTAYRVARAVSPHSLPIELAPSDPAITVDDVPAEKARDWQQQEYPVLRAMIMSAAAAGLDRHTWQLAWSVADLLYRQGAWHEWRNIQTVALAAAYRLADPVAQESSHRYLASASISLRSYEEAESHLQRALELARSDGDKARQARNLGLLGAMLTEQGRHRDGIALMEQAASLSREQGDQVCYAAALNGIGWMHAQLGEYSRAMGCCRRALALLQPLVEPSHLGATLDSLAYIHQRLGRYWEAAECGQRALELARAHGDRNAEAITLKRLGEAYRGLGNLDAARGAFDAALTTFEALDYPDAEQIRADLRALRAGQPAAVGQARAHESAPEGR